MSSPLPDPGTIDVWTVRLTASDNDLDHFSAILSPDERARQARMLAGPVRERFTVARGTLRELAARYLGLKPAAVEFTYGPRGKPAFAAPGEDLRFNLAHSDDLAVYAFATGPEIGVDVERLRDIPDLERIARRFFARDERAALDALPPADRVRSFYLAWTRKEAYVKAVGDGLHIPLDSFSVSIGSEEPARVLVFDRNSKSAGDWKLHHLEPEPGFVGAIAYQGQRKILNFMDDLNL